MTQQQASAQVLEHYRIEKELAEKLRNAPKEERRHLYSSLYDELYRRVPHHPQLRRKKSRSETARTVASQMSFLKIFLSDESTFIEIGPGDCSLSYEVSRYVRQVYAIDVSDEITQSLTSPHNFNLILSDGCSIPVRQDSIDVAYSNQLMEHLHPDDAFEQLRNIYDALIPGGIYLCITPNRLTGPHDISKYFDTVATGFHLKEYTISELRDLFGKVGFAEFGIYFKIGDKYKALPSALFVLLEKLLCVLPAGIRRKVARTNPVRRMFTCYVVGTKR